MDLAFIAFTVALTLLGTLGIGGMFLFRTGSRRKPDQAFNSGPLVGPVADLEQRIRLLRPKNYTPVVSELSLKLGNLTRLAPRSAIIKGWRELEACSAHCVSSALCDGEPLDADTRSRASLLLEEFGILDTAQAELFVELEHLRDAAFILTQAMVHPRAAFVFIDGASLLMEEIEEFEVTMRNLPQTA